MLSFLLPIVRERVYLPVSYQYGFVKGELSIRVYPLSGGRDSHVKSFGEFGLLGYCHHIRFVGNHTLSIARRRANLHRLLTFTVKGWADELDEVVVDDPIPDWVGIPTDRHPHQIRPIAEIISSYLNQHSGVDCLRADLIYNRLS